MSRELDVIIFGATGFTGQFVVEEVARTIAQDEPELKWGVAGRNKEKLLKVLEDAGKEVGQNLSGVTTVEADVNSYDSLLEMARRCRIVINTVGPYRFYGEPVVKACVEAGTHHVDISGEPQFLERIQIEYHEKAKEKGVYVVGACGWDSIPCDMGVTFAKEKFEGEINHFETFMTTKAEKGGRINYGTWQSAIYGFAHGKELGPLRRRLFSEIITKKFAKPKYALKRRSAVSRQQGISGWVVPFPGSDRSVVKRSELMKYQLYNERPAQLETYFIIPNFLHLIGMAIFGAIFATFASFGFGRTLLERYPEFFSFGMFSRTGPTREQLDATTFEMIIMGYGWPDKLAEPTDEPPNSPTKKIIAKVRGRDPGYRATSSCLVQSAITILKEADKMPLGGGVLSPGVAFSRTSLIDRLQRHEVKFEVV